MTALERAARAIYEARNGYGCKTWAHQPKEYREPYMADARAVLQAIRTPDEGMRRVMLNQDGWSIAAMAKWYGASDDAWRAMIDHILEGE